MLAEAIPKPGTQAQALLLAACCKGQCWAACNTACVQTGEGGGGHDGQGEWQRVCVGLDGCMSHEVGLGWRLLERSNRFP